MKGQETGIRVRLKSGQIAVKGTEGNMSLDAS